LQHLRKQLDQAFQMPHFSSASRFSAGIMPVIDTCHRAIGMVQHPRNNEARTTLA
jgi:molecular chaperone GrpE (heat shock protein)